MTYNSYKSVNSLKEISIVANKNEEITFDVYQEDCVTPLDITGAIIRWALFPFGQPEISSLVKDGVIVSTNRFTVSLVSTDTENLSGMYLHQPEIVLGLTVQRPSQGLFFIQPKIAS